MSSLNEHWSSPNGCHEDCPMCNEGSHCDSCDWEGIETDPIEKESERVTPGGIVPSGQCPDCGALTFPNKTPEPPFTYAPDKKDEDSAMTNGERAADSALALHDDGDDASNVVDLISNLGHYCDREGYDFAAILNTATMHWKEER